MKAIIILSSVIAAFFSLLLITYADKGLADSGSFEEIEKSDKRMYGERKIIICGYQAIEHLQIQSVILRAGLDDVPIIFADESCLEKTLKEIIALPNMFGKSVNSRMFRAIIFSGLTNKEVHRIMDFYQENGLPKQLWAALIPNSENRTLKYLLNELDSERNAFKQQKGE